MFVEQINSQQIRDDEIFNQLSTNSTDHFTEYVRHQSTFTHYQQSHSHASQSTRRRQSFAACESIIYSSINSELNWCESCHSLLSYVYNRHHTVISIHSIQFQSSAVKADPCVLLHKAKQSKVVWQERRTDSIRLQNSVQKIPFSQSVRSFLLLFHARLLLHGMCRY